MSDTNYTGTEIPLGSNQKLVNVKHCPETPLDSLYDDYFQSNPSSVLNSFVEHSDAEEPVYFEVYSQLSAATRRFYSIRTFHIFLESIKHSTNLNALTITSYKRVQRLSTASSIQELLKRVLP